MRLKEIKPGMVIHCKNISEYERLEEETIKNGYGQLPLHYQSEEFIKKVVFYIHDKNCSWGGINKNYIEFFDLIMPELTAEEAIKLHAEVCKNNCIECPLWGVYGYENCDDLCFKNPEKAVEILAKWKADHEKKEPEVEWVYRVFGAENFGDKFFNTEEEAIKRCEELAKSQKTKQYARYERVCRVKAVK